jgi:lipid A oxidase
MLVSALTSKARHRLLPDKDTAMTLRAFLLSITAVVPQVAAAEYEFSAYIGNQTAPSSDIEISGDDVIPDSDFNQQWVGNSGTWPIYGGFRLTYWQSETFGYGLDYAHNKVEPKRGREPAGFDNLEFTDGLNTWTINAYRRWPGVLDGALADVTPYVGAGVGISLPGVEVRYAGSDTFEYQVTGLAATWLAGASYPINDTWSLFGEYKGTYTQNDVDLDGGGTLSSDIFTNAVNIGISYRF